MTLRFAVEARDGDRTIGAGTHERRMVDRAGFGGGRRSARRSYNRRP